MVNLWSYFTCLDLLIDVGVVVGGGGKNNGNNVFIHQCKLITVTYE